MNKLRYTLTALYHINFAMWDFFNTIYTYTCILIICKIHQWPAFGFFNLGIHPNHDPSFKENYSSWLRCGPREPWDVLGCDAFYLAYKLHGFWIFWFGWPNLRQRSVTYLYMRVHYAVTILPNYLHKSERFLFSSKKKRYLMARNVCWWDNDINSP